MRAARRGRIINVSSLSGRVAFPLLSIYAATKHAVEGFSESLRWELEPFGIDVCLVEPGTFKTPIFFANQRRGAHDRRWTGPYGALNRDGRERSSWRGRRRRRRPTRWAGPSPGSSASPLRRSGRWSAMDARTLVDAARMVA